MLEKLYISVEQFLFPYPGVFLHLRTINISLFLIPSSFQLLQSDLLCSFFCFLQRIIIIACKYLSLLSKRAPLFCVSVLFLFIDGIKCNELSNYDENFPTLELCHGVALAIFFVLQRTPAFIYILSVFHNLVRERAHSFIGK